MSTKLNTLFLAEVVVAVAVTQILALVMQAVVVLAVFVLGQDFP
jgi:hypothetical protein